MKKNSTLQSMLTHLAQDAALSSEIDLWPTIRAHLAAGKTFSQAKEPKMKSSATNSKRFRAAFIGALTLLLALGMIFVLPQGRAWANNILRFFTRSESNQLPIQSWQLTPLPTLGTPTADPASIIDADQGIEEIQQKAGFDVYVPSWIPDSLHFAGASIEQDHKIVRIFYRYVDTNGLVLRQEPISMTNECELCGKVGADSVIQEVSIDGIYGEYVEGVWNLTDQGPVWEADPYLKTMRWQDKGMSYELLYMGPPDSLSKEDMVAIAESMK